MATPSAKKIAIEIPGKPMDPNKAVEPEWCCHHRMLETEVAVKCVQISQDKEGVLHISFLNEAPPEKKTTSPA